MHAAAKLGSFMALRANGWSLAKISKELNVSKSTLWEWDNKNQNEIHLLKHLQLEKLQEKYLPTYEEELSKLRSYLDRLETALENQDFSKMGPEYVLQMALQLRARLGRMREQVPLRPVPFNEPLVPLPYTGCVTRQDAQTFKEEFAEGQSVEDPAAAEPSQNNVAAPHESVADSPHGVPPSGGSASSANSEVSVAHPSNGDGKPHLNGHGKPVREISEIRGSDENTNRTFPDETPPGVKNRPLIINHLHNGEPNGRPVLHSQNGNGNGHHKPEDGRNE